MIVSIGLLMCASAWGAPQQFKCPPVPKQESVALKKAGRYFAVGEKMAVNGAYKKSLERYLCSLKMKEHPNTMFNIAQVAKLIEKKEPALRLLKKFKDKNPEHPAVPEITQLIDKMERGEFDAINAQSTDSEEATTTQVAEPVESEPPPPAQMATPPLDTSIASGKRSKIRKLRVAGILLIAGGTVFTGMGIGMTAGALKAQSNSSNAESDADFQYYNDRRAGLAAGAVISYIAGVACLTTGVILLIKSKKLKKKSTPQKTDLTLSPIGFTVLF